MCADVFEFSVYSMLTTLQVGTGGRIVFNISYTDHKIIPDFNPMHWIQATVKLIFKHCIIVIYMYAPPVAVLLNGDVMTSTKIANSKSWQPFQSEICVQSKQWSYSCFEFVSISFCNFSQHKSCIQVGEMWQRRKPCCNICQICC